MAKIFGSLGLVCLLGLVIAFIDAFTQIWVKRPGYQGLPVFIFFYGTAVTTVGSLATTIAIVVGEMRASARSKQIERERL
ncbi:hypothetical protein LF41_2922 [Lysobacter dokdonensis DS-58]|uniref:Uncharacterized protein n=1 Tax=Lysobacter dokdonensis DS-58 TaxID=1300345 RepID=A0A0A2WGG6_9GAMM|nr:hypothetical protein LF41_2922 [Lysobacter dokdonensis DS-58]